MFYMNKNMKNKLSDFLRYQKGEMSGKEKNSFEKELQKDPFAGEASEGFAFSTPEAISDDMKNLKKRMTKRINRKHKVVFYTIAASVAVLMVISSVFIMLERNRNEKLFSENSEQHKEFQIETAKPVTAPVPVAEAQNQIAEKSKQKSAASPETQVRRETGALSARGNDSIINRSVADNSVNNINRKEVNGASVALATERSPGLTARKASFQNKSEEDSQPVPQAGTSRSALNEMVTVGYASSLPGDEKDKTIKGYLAPEPVYGKASFETYILRNIRRPDELIIGQQEIVIIRFKVKSDGTEDSIKIEKSPGKSFSDEAIRLIKSGPAWKPAELNGKVIEDTVRVRIVFR